MGCFSGINYSITTRFWLKIKLNVHPLPKKIQKIEHSMRYWVTWLKRNDHLKKLMFTLYANAQRSGVEKKMLKDITVGLRK